MHVAVQLEFKADRKEPLGDLLRRIAALFASNGLEPEIQASFADGPAILRSTSAVERALKKHPHLAPLERNDAPRLPVPINLPNQPALPPIRRLSNVDSPATFALGDVIALADGVPRSLPFHAIHVGFGHADFGQIVFPPGLAPRLGIGVDDGWWVNGRTRSVTAFYSVEGAATAKKLPDPPPSIAAILAGLGKPKSKGQFVAPDFLTPAAAAAAPAAVPREIGIVNPILLRYKRKDLAELVQRIGLPYDLPPAGEAMQTARGASGPLKPALVDAFTPRGYDCRGGSGVFTLRRRTPTNHIVDIELDVGTWSRSVTFMFSVRGPGFNATLLPPVTARDASKQYPIGDTANWEQIVANIAAIADELDRTFVAEISAAVDPAPAWFEPGR
jgi:hypothetical protein